MMSAKTTFALVTQIKTWCALWRKLHNSLDMTIYWTPLILPKQADAARSETRTTSALQTGFKSSTVVTKYPSQMMQGSWISLWQRNKSVETRLKQQADLLFVYNVNRWINYWPWNQYKYILICRLDLTLTKNWDATILTLIERFLYVVLLYGCHRQRVALERQKRCVWHV